jgi:ABC-type molybdate transport system ATPase subunit
VQAAGSDESGAAHLLAAACAVAGPPTDVILLAGIVRTGGLLEQSAENFDAMFRVNVLAAALTAQEVAVLVSHLRRLRAQGTACIYISHKLDEVFALADRITVIRDGASITTVMSCLKVLIRWLQMENH